MPAPQTVAFDDETGADDYAALYRHIYRQRVFAVRQAVLYAAVTAMLYLGYLALDVYVEATTGSRPFQVWLTRTFPGDALAALPWAVALVVALFVANRWLAMPSSCGKLGRAILAGYRDTVEGAATGVPVPSHNTLDDDGLRVRSPGHDLAIGWPLIRRIVETRSHVFLMNSDSTGAVFRRSVIAPGTLETMRSLVARAAPTHALPPSDAAPATFVVETETTVDDALAATAWATRRKAGSKRQRVLRWARYFGIFAVCLLAGLVVGAGGIAPVFAILHDSAFALAIVGLALLYAVVFVCWWTGMRALTKAVRRRIILDFRRDPSSLASGSRSATARQTFRIGADGIVVESPGLRVLYGWPLIEALGEDDRRFFVLTTFALTFPVVKSDVPDAEREHLRRYVSERIAAVPGRNR